MFAPSVRKSLTLLVIYAVIIIGIFVVQFKNDSTISEKIGSLHLTLSESEVGEDSPPLKNRFSAAFNGIIVSADDERPASVRIGGTERPISLISWSRPTPLSCGLYFTDGVSLKFAVGGNSPLSSLSISAELPPEASELRVPYGLSSNSSVHSAEESLIQILDNKRIWALEAEEVSEGALIFSRKNPGISYAYFDLNKAFKFADAVPMNLASEAAYSGAVENLKKHLLAAFAQHQADGDFSEQTVVSYVAAMAERGKFNEAVESVSESFKHSSARTYLSAPYFDTLSEMNKSLQAQILNFEKAVRAAAQSKSNDVFSIRNIADYMCMNPSSASVQTALKNAADANFSDVSVADAASILDCYVELFNKNEGLASILRPAAEKCVSVIERACEVDDKSAVLSEKGAFIPVLQAAKAGSALLRYGRIIQEQTYIAGGRLIIASCLQDSASFDLRTTGELYPLVVKNNQFYPHYKILAVENARAAVWAWTCAEDIRYENDSASDITISIDFPTSQTHYVIINGITPFSSIYIYNIAFRTDPRFETYNSSGYVYQQNTNTLLLKSRHRSATENIRLVRARPAEADGVAAVETAGN